MPERGALDVVGRVREASRRLTPAERKVAEVVAADPQAVAFGTVAELARRAGASGATVVRLATRLGFEGFADLQDAVRDELADRLRPAAARIRRPAADDVVGAVLAASVHSVTTTLGEIEPDDFDRAVGLLADERRGVRFLLGDAADGVVRHAAQELAMLRDGVETVGGNPVAVARRLAHAAAGDVLVVVDVRRYESWLMPVVERWIDGGGLVVALTDGPLAPVAARAEVLFVIDTEGPGPFDHYVGAVALLAALVAGVARVRTATAVDRLDAIEAAWAGAGALDEPD